MCLCIYFPLHLTNTRQQKQHKCYGYPAHPSLQHSLGGVVQLECDLGMLVLARMEMVVYWMANTEALSVGEVGRKSLQFDFAKLLHNFSST